MKLFCTRTIGIGLLSIALPAMVFAQGGSSTPEKGTISGVVTAKAESSLTLAADGGGTFTVSFASGAKIENAAGVSIAFADISVGDRIRVAGSITGSISADSLKDLSLAMRTFEGVIGAKAGSSFTLVTRNFRLVTILTTSTTVTTKDGATITFADLAIGARVKATGMWNESGNTLTAASVHLTAAPAPQPVDMTIVGLVTLLSSDGKTLLLVTGDLSVWTITRADATVFRKDGTLASWADIMLGAQLKVRGSANKNARTMTASRIDIMTFERAHVTMNGTVIARTASSLTIKPKKWPAVTVDISGATLVDKRGDTIARADIKLGDNVQVKGLRAHSSLFMTAEVVKDHSIKLKKDKDDEGEDDDED